MIHTTSVFTRDHFGVRPFYYSHVGNELVWSDRLDEVLAHPGVSARLHEPAIADFLLFGLNQDPETTTFADVRSLAPGHSLLFENGEVRTRRDWTLPVEEVRFRRPEEYGERFRELLGEAVRGRLRDAGDAAAVLMSGGLDSTSIAALVARTGACAPPEEGARSVPLTAYTLVYDSLVRHEERRYAGAVANHLRLPVEFVPADGYRLFAKWDDPSYRTPEPIDNPLWAVPVDLFRRIAAEGHRVVLSGEAGDAVAAPVQALPELLFAALQADATKTRVPDATKAGAPPDAAKAGALPDAAKAGALRLLARDLLRFRRERGTWPPFGVRAWWRRKVRGGMGDHEPPAHLAVLDPAFARRVDARDRCREHPDAGWAHHELQSPMWPWCAVTQSRAWTGADVEVRYPFLDVRLVSFMLSVPSVPWAYDKELMRTAMRGLLPDEVLRRPKAPLWDDPVAALMRRDGPPPMPAAGSRVWEYVGRKAFETMYAGGAERAREITRVICLARWLDSVS